MFPRKWNRHVPEPRSLTSCFIDLPDSVTPFFQNPQGKSRISTISAMMTIICIATKTWPGELQRSCLTPLYIICQLWLAGWRKFFSYVRKVKISRDHPNKANDFMPLSGD